MTDPKKRRKFRLRKPEVTRVDLVDRGANQNSHILLAKRDDMPLPFSQKDPRLLNRPASPGIGQTPPSARPGMPRPTPTATPGAGAPGAGGSPRPLAGLAGQLQAQATAPAGQRPAAQPVPSGEEGPDPDMMDGDEDDLLTELLRTRMRRRQFAKPPKKKTPQAQAPVQAPNAFGKSLDDVLETITKGLTTAGVFTQDATGRDLRDMLPKDALTNLGNIVSTSKSAKPMEDHMNEAELAALVDDLPDELIDYIGELEDRAETAEVEVEKLRKSAEGEGEEVDPIAKALSSLPEEVAVIVKAQQDRLAAAEEALAQEKIAKADSTFITKARSFDGLIDKAEDFGPVLRQFAEAHPEAAETLEASLRAASQRLSKSALFGEYGHATPGTGSAETEIEAIAKSYQDADPEISLSDAKALAWERNPEMYERHVAEQRERTR